MFELIENNYTKLKIQTEGSIRKKSKESNAGDEKEEDFRKGWTEPRKPDPGSKSPSGPPDKDYKHVNK